MDTTIINNKEEREKEKKTEVKTNINPLKKPVITSDLSSDLNKEFNNLKISKIDTFEQVKKAAQSLEQMQELANVFIKGEMCSLKTSADVIIAITTGNQYNLPFMTSISYIYPIKGRPSMSIHLHRALLLSNGITFTKNRDFEDVYAFLKVDDEGKVVKIKNKNNEAVPVILSKGTIDKKPEKKCALKVIDKITEYTFKRLIKLPNNNWETIKIISNFTLKEAGIAGLLDKENWVKYERRMLEARAFTIGSKEIAADLLLGIPSINEMADMNNISYTISEDLVETINV